MKSVLSLLYIVILQILWLCRLLYEAAVNSNVNESEPNDGQSKERKDGLFENEKRHLIHLFTTTPNGENGRPVCRMHVCRIITATEEEMLRCACAKGGLPPNSPYYHYTQPYLPPSKRVSKGSLPNAWIDSFSLVF